MRRDYNLIIKKISIYVFIIKCDKCYKLVKKTKKINQKKI